jgi:hypothetical protein
MRPSIFLPSASMQSPAQAASRTPSTCTALYSVANMVGSIKSSESTMPM